MKKIIVVGASAASIAFITKLRTFDKQSQILCFSGEADLPYNRCFLADFLTDELSHDQLRLKPQDFFEQHTVQLKLQTWVTKIDTVNKKVLANDVWHQYDYLFLGMGTKPYVPKFIQDSMVQGLFNFHTLQDMQNLKQYVQEYKPIKAIVIGAGLNGIEAASSLLQMGMTVGLVESDRQLLPGQLDESGAAWVANLMRHKGVALFLGHKAINLCSEQNRVTALRLDSGAVIPADVIVVAAGSVVNSQILHDTGIVLQDGCVLVDTFLKTNIPDVFAAGDLCMVRDMRTDLPARSTTWSDAMLQGLCAATNLSQTARPYPGMVGLRDSYFFEKDFYACGQTVRHEADVELICKTDDHSLKIWYVKNEMLIGFVLIGDISNLAEYKKWYSTGQKVDSAMFNLG